MPRPARGASARTPRGSTGRGARGPGPPASGRSEKRPGRRPSTSGSRARPRPGACMVAACRRNCGQGLDCGPRPRTLHRLHPSAGHRRRARGRPDGDVPPGSPIAADATGTSAIAEPYLEPPFEPQARPAAAIRGHLAWTPGSSSISAGVKTLKRRGDRRSTTWWQRPHSSIATLNHSRERAGRSIAISVSAAPREVSARQGSRSTATDRLTPEFPAAPISEGSGTFVDG